MDRQVMKRALEKSREAKWRKRPIIERQTVEKEGVKSRQQSRAGRNVAGRQM